VGAAPGERGAIRDDAVALIARLRNGLELPYAEHGDPGGVPVVMLHAYVESLHSFDLVADHLPGSIHASVPTLRGHPGATVPAAGYSLEDFSADVGEFMDAVGLERAVLVGGSSGGYVAQRFALDNPGRVAGLVLCGCPRSLRQPPSILDAVLTLEDPVDPGFVREFTASTVSDAVPAAFLEQMIEVACAVPAQVCKSTLVGLIEAMPPTETGTIDVPTVVLWGEDDAYLPLAEQQALTGAIPGARLVTYPATGHIVQWERPREVAEQITGTAASAGK
jgi:rifampin ADP-ribosylating transferase